MFRNSLSRFIECLYLFRSNWIYCVHFLKTIFCLFMCPYWSFNKMVVPSPSLGSHSFYFTSLTKPKNIKLQKNSSFPAFHLITHFNVNTILSQSAVGISSQKVWITIAVWIGASCEKHLDAARNTSLRIQYLDTNKAKWYSKM